MADRDLELLPTEQPLASAHRHWIVLLHAPPRRWILWAVVVVLLLALVAAGTWPLRLLSLALLVLFGWLRWRTWYLDKLTVTDRRVLRVYGFLTTRKAHISLTRVSDITTEQTVAGKLFGFHHISIESASEHPALSRLTFIHHAEPFMEQLRLEVYGKPGDVAQHATGPIPHVPPRS